MEQRLIQSQSQKLILSPQIRQYLRLLQLPVAELRSAIEEELAENPVLEEVSKEGPDEASPTRAEEERAQADRNTEELRFDQTVHSLDKMDENFREEFYSQEDLSRSEGRDLQSRRDYQESLITRKESLFEYLLWQIGFLDLNEAERKIAEEIVGNLTEEGYLKAPLDEIAGTSGQTPAEVEGVLRKIQGLDPPGIAARNLQETLLLQLERKGPEAELARKIVREHLPLLEKKRWDLIAKQVKSTPEEIQQAARLIARLDPKPGRSFYSEDPIAVTPDATVYFEEFDEKPEGSKGPLPENGKLLIEVHDEEIPELRISSHYRRMLRDPKLDATSRKFIKEKIQAALDFVKALSQRRSTLGEITEEIVNAQREFFEKGFSELRPLRLKDISERLRIHESTVSRAVQGKYLSTPQGTIAYKSFFSSKLETAEGEPESQKSMMEKIRGLIHSEDPRNPLSDEKIAKILQREGVHIARRTVAKYRELLKILPSHLRRTK